MFIDENILRNGTWQAFERNVGRLLLYDGFSGIRMVGQTADKGADILAYKFGKRWLFQVKHWQIKIGVDVVDKTLDAARIYRANIPVIVSLNGFENEVMEHQRTLLSRGIPLQLWDICTLLARAKKLPEEYMFRHTPREYQENAIQAIVKKSMEKEPNKALVVMATGLGKTFVAAEAIRRIDNIAKSKFLVVAHTNELVYQLEKSFWPFLKVGQNTVIWNGYEHPSPESLERASFVFGCLKSISDYIQLGGEIPAFDVVLVDECHHVGALMYENILSETRAGQSNGSFLIGLTATPWRPDEKDIYQYFGEPIVCIDIVTGLREGFLSNIDYRMYTDNINWDAIKTLEGTRFSPRQINRTLFINQWDDSVVKELMLAWKEQSKPRAIVFCGTVDHAITMRDRINAMGFCNAAAIYSKTSAGKIMGAFERNRILSDFHDGTIDVICAVDIFNEGVDVPDVNIIVFQRVTHSRRIFVQQLGRGLRLAPEKDKVIVLDFVSDIRRFAAGLELKDNICGEDRKTVRISLPHKVTFRKVGGEDEETEGFLRQWIEDVAAIENAGEDASILKFPPELPGGKK